MVRLTVAACVAFLALQAGATQAGEPSAYFTDTVVYQCPGERPQQFQYPTEWRTPNYSEARLETQWYWNRTRADHGEGCRILSFQDQPYPLR